MTTTVDYERNMVLATKTYDVVGTRPIRHDGADKVTGRALYGADYDTAGLLHGHVVRSPHAHANIRSIDTSKAEALEGVLAVVTNADFTGDAEGMVDMGEGAPTSLKWLRDNILASDKATVQGPRRSRCRRRQPPCCRSRRRTDRGGLRSPASGRDRRGGDG